MREEEVLSINQMKELQKLGVDTSSARYFWDYQFNNELYHVKYHDRLKKYIDAGYGIGAFTLNDVLKLLPPYYKRKDEILRFEIEEGSSGWTCKYLHVQLFVRETMLEAAYEMLKWINHKAK